MTNRILHFSNSSFVKISVGVLLLIALITSAHELASGSSGYGNISTVDLSATFAKGDAISIHLTNSANISGLLILGGQYISSSQTSVAGADLIVQPLNVTIYSLEMFAVGSNQSFSINVWRIPSAGQSSLLAGYAETANSIVNLKIILRIIGPTTSSSSEQDSSWNPFFGITGIKIGPVTITTSMMIQILGVLSVALLLSGLYLKKAKLGYLGACLLGIVLFVTLGVLILIIGAICYLAGFAILNFAWRFKSKLSKNQQPGSGGV